MRLAQSLVIGGLLALAPQLLAAQAADTTAASVFEESQVQTRPRVIPGSCQTPEYPQELRSAGIEGRVVIEFVVDATGKPEPKSLKIVSAESDAFEPNARRSILTCRFRPGVKDGTPVRVKVRQPVDFTMR